MIVMNVREKRLELLANARQVGINRVWFDVGGKEYDIEW